MRMPTTATLLERGPYTRILTVAYEPTTLTPDPWVTLSHLYLWKDGRFVAQRDYNGEGQDTPYSTHPMRTDGKQKWPSYATADDVRAALIDGLIRPPFGWSVNLAVDGATLETILERTHRDMPFPLEVTLAPPSKGDQAPESAWWTVGMRSSATLEGPSGARVTYGMPHMVTSAALAYSALTRLLADRHAGTAVAG